ncbi:UNVERIFIED_CONTAM: hypothetical protein FKN15_028802 [Acipenser sinensis]
MAAFSVGYSIIAAGSRVLAAACASPVSWGRRWLAHCSRAHPAEIAIASNTSR